MRSVSSRDPGFWIQHKHTEVCLYFQVDDRKDVNLSLCIGTWHDGTSADNCVNALNITIPFTGMLPRCTIQIISWISHRRFNYCVLHHCELVRYIIPSSISIHLKSTLRFSVEYTTTDVSVLFTLDGVQVGRYKHIPNTSSDFSYREDSAFKRTGSRHWFFIQTCQCLHPNHWNAESTRLSYRRMDPRDWFFLTITHTRKFWIYFVNVIPDVAIEPRKLNQAPSQLQLKNLLYRRSQLPLRHPPLDRTLERSDLQIITRVFRQVLTT